MKPQVIMEAIERASETVDNYPLKHMVNAETVYLPTIGYIKVMKILPNINEYNDIKTIVLHFVVVGLSKTYEIEIDCSSWDSIYDYRVFEVEEYQEMVTKYRRVE